MQYRALLALCLLATIVRTSAAEDPAAFDVGPLKFQRPPEWKWVPVSSPMRKAQLSIPGTDPAKPAELTFFHFGQGQGGDVQANAQRWLQQFKSKEGAQKIEPLETGGAKVTLVSTEGTFAGGMPGQPSKPMDDYALLGAIIESDSGAVFAKMTGPSATVKAARGKFIDFIKAAAATK
jgi:hypothetical protein